MLVQFWSRFNVFPECFGSRCYSDVLSIWCCSPVVLTWFEYSYGVVLSDGAQVLESSPLIFLLT